MADAFDDRRDAFEKKFKLDQEQQFKALARRNRMLGEWLGERMGLNASEIPGYAQAVIAADLEEPGDEDVIRKVMADIAEHDAAVSEDEVREKLVEFLEVAAAEIAGNG